MVEVVQIVDGKWELTEEGIPYYDRVVALGDMDWTDYEVTVEVTFHSYAKPSPGPPNYNVTHAGIGLRWRGHQEDQRQPRRQWYPLGAATEFRLMDDLKDCRWRILDDHDQSSNEEQGRKIVLGTQYTLKARFETLEGPKTRYRVKIWKTGEKEPDEWDLEDIEGKTDFQSGSVLLVAHHTDVTFHDILVIPLGE